jgi:hypothetical protein
MRREAHRHTSSNLPGRSRRIFTRKTSPGLMKTKGQPQVDFRASPYTEKSPIHSIDTGAFYHVRTQETRNISEML